MFNSLFIDSADKFNKNKIQFTCVCVGCPLSLHGIPRACKTCTVIFRIGASYNNDISTLPYLPIVDDGDCERLISQSDFKDAKSLVSNNGSCDKTTMHFIPKKKKKRTKQHLNCILAHMNIIFMIHTS